MRRDPERLRILVIDDSESDIALIEEALQDQAELDVATDGAAALEALSQTRAQGEALPQLILLDLNMPGMNGFDVLRRLKTDPAMRGIPVIILSTSEDPRDVRRCYESAAASYIAKPAGFDELETKLRCACSFFCEVARLPIFA